MTDPAKAQTESKPPDNDNIAATSIEAITAFTGAGEDALLRRLAEILGRRSAALTDPPDTTQPKGTPDDPPA